MISFKRWSHLCCSAANTALLWTYLRLASEMSAISSRNFWTRPLTGGCMAKGYQNVIQR
jgi:hypothetical protein